MSIDLDSKLVETCQKISITTNEYGDKVYGSSADVKCLYRDISTLNQLSNRNEVSIDGLLWFRADAEVAKGNIFNHPDEGYLEIKKVIRAKTLVTSNVRKFIKCEVAKVRQIS